MASLLDIGPLSETVSLRGKDIKLQGIGADALVALFDRCPALYDAMARRQDMDAAALVKLGPDIVAQVIATAAGEGDDPKVVSNVKTFTVGEWMELLVPIFRMTFPRGFGPFVEDLERLSGGAGAAGVARVLSGKDPGTKSE